MIWLRSTVFHCAFWLLTISAGVLILPLMVWPRLVRKACDIWVCISLFLLRVCCGLHVEVRGAEHIPETPAIFASKHQSTLDTLVLWHWLHGPAFILKRALLFVPFFGWCLWRTEPIAIARNNRGQALAMIARLAAERVAAGRHVMIFPEGTRTQPGAETQYRTAGLTTLYSNLNVPVVPVALNCGLFWPKRSYVKCAGIAVVEFFPAVPAGLPPKEVAEQVKQQIEQASLALLPKD